MKDNEEEWNEHVHGSVIHLIQLLSFIIYTSPIKQSS
jgi:hypothetical protein